MVVDIEIDLSPSKEVREVERRRRRSRQVELKKRGKDPGNNLTCKGENIKTKKKDWTKDGNKLIYTRVFRGYSFWGYTYIHMQRYKEDRAWYRFHIVLDSGLYYYYRN